MLKKVEYWYVVYSVIIIVALQNAFDKLKKLDEHLERVKVQSAAVAEYFCDERDDFVTKVFEEMWKFVAAFIKCTKVH